MSFVRRSPRKGMAREFGTSRSDDYPVWELDWVGGPEMTGRIANWCKRLAGGMSAHLPPDHPRPPAQTHGMSSQCVHEIITSQVESTPDAVAVQVGSTTLTYRQLNDRAAVIASRLVQAGAGPGTVVAVLLDRTPDLVAAIVGILKSGAALLPLDPRQPAVRNAFCINDVGANVIVTDSVLPTGGAAVTAAIIDLGDPGPHTTHQVARSS